MFFFSEFKIPFHTCVIRQPKLFQTIVSDEFLKQCETEAFLKFYSCFSAEFARQKKYIRLWETAVTLPRWVQIY